MTLCRRLHRRHQLTRDPRTDFEEGGRPTPRDQIVINEILTLRAVVARYRASALATVKVSVSQMGKNSVCIQSNP